MDLDTGGLREIRKGSDSIFTGIEAVPQGGPNRSRYPSNFTFFRVRSELMDRTFPNTDRSGQPLS
jgi:hypothetical protein